MSKEDTTGILILLAIVAIALFGGSKNTGVTQPAPTSNETQKQTEMSVEQKVRDTKNQIDDLKKQLQIEEDKKTQSQYKGVITLSYINRSTNPSQEYVTIKMVGNATGTVPVTGWVLKSLNTKNQTTIPKASYLFFAGTMNTEDNIFLIGGDTLYLITGISPNGSSFRANKCSGYLGQFQTFVPYLNSNCPAPRDEDLSSIPKTTANDRCFDYIDSMQTCKIQTETPPQYLGVECNNFISRKINYSSCVDTHKNDKDFYLKEWRVYLKRGESLWKDKREIIVLYDNFGKVVDTLKY